VSTSHFGGDFELLGARAFLVFGFVAAALHTPLRGNAADLERHGWYYPFLCCAHYSLDMAARVCPDFFGCCSTF
jgi:hypothetical protein